MNKLTTKEKIEHDANKMVFKRKDEGINEDVFQEGKEKEVEWEKEENKKQEVEKQKGGEEEPRDVE